MKTSIQKSINNISWLVLFVAAAWSCQQENVGRQTPAQTQAQTEMTAKDNSQIIATTQDVMDVTAGALAGQGVTDGSASSYGRTRGPELDCAPSISGTFDIDRSHTDSVIYRGSITIDYGTGTSCQDSTEIKKGKIIDSFVFIKSFNDSVSYNLTETVSFQGFQKDTVQIDGTFVSTSSSNQISSLDIQNAKITYTDGTSVSWNGKLTNTFHRVVDPWKKNDYSKEVSGSITGTSRSGVAFSASITKSILFEYACSRNIPVSGTIDLINGGVDSVIDYGDGSCDKKYTITTAGKTTEYTFKRHDHDD